MVQDPPTHGAPNGIYGWAARIHAKKFELGHDVYAMRNEVAVRYVENFDSGTRCSLARSTTITLLTPAREVLRVAERRPEIFEEECGRKELLYKVSCVSKGKVHARIQLRWRT
jgi:hypothetical protein